MSTGKKASETPTIQLLSEGKKGKTNRKGSSSLRRIILSNRTRIKRILALTSINPEMTGRAASTPVNILRQNDVASAH